MTSTCRDTTTVQGNKPSVLVPAEEQEEISTHAQTQMEMLLRSVALGLSHINQPDSEWLTMRETEDQSIYSKLETEQNAVSILGTTEINCTMNEMAQLMTVNTSSGFRMLMKLLHDRNFIDGTIVLRELLDDHKEKGIDAPEGLMSVKWFAYRNGGYLSKPKAFCMLDHTQRFTHLQNQTLVRFMQPMVGSEYSFLTKKYTACALEYAIIAEEIEPMKLKIICVGQTPQGDMNIASGMRDVALNMVQDTLSELENAIITARISRQCNDTKRRIRWVQDHERLRCSLCSGAFSTFSRRKHHCRVCGEITCAPCSSIRRAHLNAIGLTRLRVCVACSSVKEERVVVKRTGLSRSTTYNGPNRMEVGPRRKESDTDFKQLIRTIGKKSDLEQYPNINTKLAGLAIERVQETIEFDDTESEASEDEMELLQSDGIESDRLELLQSIGRPVFVTASNTSLFMQCEIARETLNASSACVVIVDRTTTFFEYTIGTDVCKLRRDESLADLVFADPDVLLVKDCTKDPSTRDAELVTLHNVGFFAGCTININNLPIGCLYIFDQKPRERIGVSDRAVMKKIARMIASDLEKKL